MTWRESVKTVITSPTGRALLIAFLLIGQVGFMVWYGGLDPAPEAGAYAGPYELTRDYDAYIGQRVSLAGYVVASEPVTIRVGGAADLPLVVQNAPPGVKSGDRLRLFATVLPDHHLRAIDAFTTSSGSQMGMYAISLLAGIWALVRLVRHWRLDFDEWALVPRSRDTSKVDTDSATPDSTAGGSDVA